MRDVLLKLYHRLPASLRSVAASLHGLYLHSWRYGPETERLVAEALEREQWSPERWKVWQEERLTYVLHRAVTQVPYYREQWAARRRKGERASWEYLENWPILEKQLLRQNPAAFVADDCSARHMFHDHTSGTTGTPLDLLLSKETVRAWYALYEARLRRWNGVSQNENWAILGGQPVVPARAQRPPFWVWNAPMKQLYLSANHISQRTTPAYIAALARYRITHMIVYSSSASFLAREAINLGLVVTGLKVVITNAEALFPWQRETIRQGFGSEVRESYGMAEVVVAASECGSGTLHLWPEVGWLEVLSDERNIPVQYGTTGHLISTGLLNADMPLIRYMVGDRGGIASAADGTSCRCDRKLPALYSIEGRANDLLITHDGRRVYCPLSTIFSALPVCEAQIIQENLNRIRIRYVPASSFTCGDERLIRSRLQERMGKVEVLFEQTTGIPRGSNGKFQPVICNLLEKERVILGRP